MTTRWCRIRGNNTRKWAPALLVLLLTALGAPGTSPPAAQMEDVALSSGITFRHSNGFSENKYLAEITGSGCAFLDYDGDGYLDIFLVNGRSAAASAGGSSGASSAANHALYRNRQDGTFVETTIAAGILPNRAWGMGVAAADYDNDGDTDLFITQFEGPNLLYRNDGGKFSEVAAEARVQGDGRWSSSAAFFDYDKDGLLDLYVARYTDHSYARNYICPVGQPAQKSYCSPKVYGGVPDLLYHNSGDGSFRDVSAAMGVGAHKGKGLGVVTGDFDRDGWPDVYVANDQTPNLLFRNDRGKAFREVAMEMGVALDEDGAAQAGMGVDFGDYDNDGQLDIVVSNLDMEYLALYRNSKGEMFEDVSAATGLKRATSPYVGFGVRFLDFDNDGWLDLFLANGHVLDNPELIRPDATFAQPKLLLKNAGGHFRDITASAGKALLAPRVSRGVAFGDYDNDGDVDVLVNNSGAPPQLFRNNEGSRQGWLTLELRGRKSNRDGVGASVEISAGGRRRLFEVSGGSSYMASHDRRIHVGLGNLRKADEIVVHWPSGVIDRRRDIAARTTMRIEEGAGPAR